ncbi:double-stranded RNA-binding protein 1-like [Gastrolobium bilobum]|uniref:double-stranded RNA-binding protein 1-like n=1 Tax=Gastrolobium bilobum TaxID=150636 RepID=UPI002AB12D44|nr:double-stranded RNA-binding protein 1-like [Gastrolobium bilobum]
MYKTKLQELCHQRRWGLPKYSAMKDGPEHMPSFEACVSVNGVTFSSPRAFSSSKEAHNQAAMLAFLSLSSPPLDSSTPTAEYDTKEQIGAAKPQHFPIPAHSSVVIDDMDRLCKSQLHNYARRNNHDSPIFTCKTEGPSHATRFKAKVVVDGQSFESAAFFNTIKEAEHAAAKAALMSLSLDIFQKADSCPFKNLLLELTQREGFCKPMYKTMQSGSPHIATFFSIVEVEGKEFHGKVAKSKKQAEHNAAKVAYIALRECGFNIDAAPSASLIENNAVQSIHQTDELSEVDLNKILPGNVKISNEVYNPSFLQPSEEDMMSNRSTSPFSPKISSAVSQLDLSCKSNSGSNKAEIPKPSSYLLCNRFKVYTCFPDTPFPKGITVLPISDNKWVAVSLEFPNDKDL